MAGKEDGQICSLVGDKLNATSGESEGGEGRLVTLNNAIGIDVLERRVKAHLQLSQSLFVSSFIRLTPRVNYLERPVIQNINYSSSWISSRPITFIAGTHYCHMCWVGWLDAGRSRCGCISHRGDATRTHSLLVATANKLIIVTSARGFGCSRSWETRHSL